MTPSAINPMEVSNYQDELNNFIMSRSANGGVGQGGQQTSGLNSANDSNRYVSKGASSMIHTNRFQYAVAKFEHGGDSPKCDAICIN